MNEALRETVWNMDEKTGLEIQNGQGGSSCFSVWFFSLNIRTDPGLPLHSWWGYLFHFFMWVDHPCFFNRNVFQCHVEHKGEIGGGQLIMAWMAIIPSMYIYYYKGFKEMVSRDPLHKYAYYYLRCSSHTK